MDEPIIPIYVENFIIKISGRTKSLLKIEKENELGNQSLLTDETIIKIQKLKNKLNDHLAIILTFINDSSFYRLEQKIIVWKKFYVNDSGFSNLLEKLSSRVFTPLSTLDMSIYKIREELLEYMIRNADEFFKSTENQQVESLVDIARESDPLLKSNNSSLYTVEF
ncbi:hypothetical protein N9Y92_00790 [Chlamydiales bacterium]|nr:hypothetical protein [Chlamydiales bacterium]